jgi:hypothetical protein
MEQEDIHDAKKRKPFKAWVKGPIKRRAPGGNPGIGKVLGVA